MNQHESFLNLHHQDSPLLLGNVWNAHSAQIFQDLGFKAVGTSSAAIASTLGYEDGENMPFDDLLRIVANIQSKIDIPLTVDIESGYASDVTQIVHNIENLCKLGVVGINLEDSVVGGKRELVDAAEFAEKLLRIKANLRQNDINVFINVRTDPYVVGLEDAYAEAVKRSQLYSESGVDGIFVPAIINESEIRGVVESTQLPINVMCMPDLPCFQTLGKLGVKRVSMGPFIYNDSISNMQDSIKTVVDEQSFEILFPKQLKE
ncbi:MAG: isocitrate lyase/phosphoenolpyruvate mutase family protein [Verrucomicrobiales bacterium]|nr:isocitrate lyase/phosphoenolpyruvate mutase family protein [Verrucomicrobiales bacterium]